MLTLFNKLFNIVKLTSEIAPLTTSRIHAQGRLSPLINTQSVSVRGASLRITYGPLALDTP